jgi:hypothetical protein
VPGRWLAAGPDLGSARNKSVVFHLFKNFSTNLN